MGMAHMIVIVQVRPGEYRLDQGFGLRLEWDDYVVSDWYMCDA